MQAKPGWLATWTLGLCLVSASAIAETLYKLIDSNGKVTYSEKPPKEFNGKVIRLDIDPNANTATLPKPPSKGDNARPESEAAKIIHRPAAGIDPRVRAERSKLEAARKELADAQGREEEGDFTLIRNAGGGVRRVPTEQYTARVSALEKAVKDAEQSLAIAERNVAR